MQIILYIGLLTSINNLFYKQKLINVSFFLVCFYTITENLCSVCFLKHVIAVRYQQPSYQQ